MLITIMCNVSLGSPYTTSIVPVQALPQFFNQSFAYKRGYQILNTLGTNFVGYGLAGLCRPFLVWPSFAVWPATFNNLALIKAFHSGVNEPVKGPFGWVFTASREKFFLLTFTGMAIYYVIPGYLFTAVSQVSFYEDILCVAMVTDQLDVMDNLDLPEQYRPRCRHRDVWWHGSEPLAHL